MNTVTKTKQGERSEAKPSMGFFIIPSRSALLRVCRVMVKRRRRATQTWLIPVILTLATGIAIYNVYQFQSSTSHTASYLMSHFKPSADAAPAATSTSSSSTSSRCSKHNNNDNNDHDHDHDDNDIYELARNESFGLLSDIPQESWRRRKERVRQGNNHLYPDDPRFNSRTPSAWYQENFEPDFTCPHERRVGPMGEGGKWIW
jgi:hypothetical protein